MTCWDDSRPRIARGFRNPTNDRLRMILAAEGYPPKSPMSPFRLSADDRACRPSLGSERPQDSEAE